MARDIMRSNCATKCLRKFTHMEKLEGMIHGHRFYLSHSTAIHTHDVWYVARVIDSDFTHTRKVVLAST